MRDIRTLLGMTQDQFAAATKINQSTISRWESRGSTPSADALARIRRAAVRRYPEWSDSLFFSPSAVRAAIASRKTQKEIPPR
jgi:transcriptional regulator with XRE-family HTH domain